MAKRLTIIILFIVMFTGLPVQNAFAQGQDRNNYSSSHTGPRQQVATIIFAGLAGAVLGLSTLSFYGRPQERLSNIGVGFALGVIVGASFTTYKAANRPYENYESAQSSILEKEVASLKSPIFISYSWDF